MLSTCTCTFLHNSWDEACKHDTLARLSCGCNLTHLPILHKNPATLILDVLDIFQYMEEYRRKSFLHGMGEEGGQHDIQAMPSCGCRLNY